MSVVWKHFKKDLENNNAICDLCLLQFYLKYIRRLNKRIIVRIVQSCYIFSLTIHGLKPTFERFDATLAAIPFGSNKHTAINIRSLIEECLTKNVLKKEKVIALVR